MGLGTMMLERGDTAQGEKAVRRGIELSPNFWLGHYELGRALFTENKLSDALKSAEQAKSLAPSAPIVYRLLSNIHLRRNDYPALLADIDAYLKLDPDSPAGNSREAIARSSCAESWRCEEYAGRGSETLNETKDRKACGRSWSRANARQFARRTLEFRSSRNRERTWDAARRGPSA